MLNAKQETRLKTQEMSLQQKYDLIVQGLNATSLGVWEWDVLHGNYIVWDDNIHRIFGWELQTFPGSFEAFKDCLHTNDLERVEQEYNYALTNLEHFEGSYRIIRKDNQKQVWISFKAKCFRNKQGQVTHLRGVAWDSTQEKIREISERSLQQREIRSKELEQFVYVASHDLQEPLRTVNSVVEWLQENYTNQLDSNAVQCLHFLTQASTRMSKLIKGLLDYARLGRDRDMVLIDCNKLLEDVLEDMSAIITETQTNFTKATVLPTLNGYEVELRLLFQNLLSNAIRFRKIGENPTIVLRVYSEENYWLFAFKDNGIGIDEEQLEKIFVMFQRLHIRNKYEGAGIGLAHCRKIVELHGGKIWVDSKPNEGSVFYFTIPK